MDRADQSQDSADDVFESAIWFANLLKIKYITRTLASDKNSSTAATLLKIIRDGFRRLRWRKRQLAESQTRTHRACWPYCWLYWLWLASPAPVNPTACSMGPGLTLSRPPAPNSPLQQAPPTDYMSERLS